MKPRLEKLMIAAFERLVPSTHEDVQVSAAVVTEVSKEIMDRIRGRWVELSAASNAVSVGATPNVTATGPLLLQAASPAVERLIGPADRLFHVGDGTNGATLVIAWREDSPVIAERGETDCG